jgi:hypothetical protein
MAAAAGEVATHLNASHCEAQAYSIYAILKLLQCSPHSGLYPKDLPFVAGLEGAGVVEELGPEAKVWLPAQCKVKHPLSCWMIKQA